MITKKMLEEKEDNYYQSSFFYLKIDTDDSLDKILDSQNESTLIHEYIHFLQDISLCFGRYNLVQNINRLRAMSDIILKEGMNTRPIPIDTVHSISVNSALNKIYWGDFVFEKDIEIKSITKRNKSVAMLNEPVEHIEVQIDEKTIELGGIHLLENQALLVEEALYGKQNLPDVPYRIIEKVIDFMYPRLNRGPEYVSAICECCLMTLNPSVFLYDSITRMKAEKWIPQRYAEIYKYLFNNLSFKGITPDGFHNVNELFQYLSIESEQFVLDTIKSPIYQDAQKWAHNTLSWGFDKRLNEPLFITDILENGSIDNIKIKFLYKTGTPLVLNNKNEGWGIEKKYGEAVVVFKAIYEIFDFLKSQRLNCNLFAFCRKLENDNIAKYVTSAECHCNPQSKIMEKNLCPFAGFWKTWGFYNYNIK